MVNYINNQKNTNADILAPYSSFDIFQENCPYKNVSCDGKRVNGCKKCFGVNEYNQNNGQPFLDPEYFKRLSIDVEDHNRKLAKECRLYNITGTCSFKNQFTQCMYCFRDYGRK